MYRTALACTALVSIALLGSAWLTAGPLSPPAGPVASTYKTLAEVEPRTAMSAANTPGDADSVYRITQSGSYYLTGNVAGVAGKHGIEIAASEVSIDLRGFEIAGVPGSLDGLNVPAAGLLSNITITNGTITNFGSDGVDAFNTLGTRLSNLHASGNGQEGLMTGDNALVERCVARANGVSGIRVNNGGTVIDCSAANNTTRGFISASGCVISRCSSISNAGYGFVVANSTIVDSSAHNNVSAGIFSAGHATISRCTIRASGGDGIQAGEACAIEHCVVRANAGDGIEVFSDCRVEHNLIDDNGTGDGASIRALGTRNRIEHNRCANADRGLDIDQGGNFIAGNIVVHHTDNYAIDGVNAAEILLSEIPEGISFPCSVKLAGSLRVVGTGNGISINNADVDIDLCGFTLEGVPLSGVGVIVVTGVPERVVRLRNGTIRGWGAEGAALLNAKGCVVENVSFIANGAGLNGGLGSVVTGCAARGNVSAGFVDAGSSAFRDCASSDNGTSGFQLGSGTVAENCTATGNGGRGFVTTIGTSVRQCVASFNGESGIFVQGGCTIIDNTCHSNGVSALFGAGIQTITGGGVGARIEGNNCTSNDVGISLAGIGAVVLRNTAHGNGVNYSIGNQNASAQVLNVANLVGFVSTDPNANLAY
jgi:hypothetical protein